MRKLSELTRLSGRTALITGACGHIGRAMSEALAELGADLILCDLDMGNLEAFAGELTRDYSIKTHPMLLDLENREALENIRESLEPHRGALSILINNAAFVGTSNLSGWNAPFEEQSMTAWDRALNVNLSAVFALTQQLQPLLKEGNGASVINVGSIYGVYGPDYSLYEGTNMNNPAAYAASKGGLLQLTRWLSTVMAPDIRVNAISPGGVFRSQDERFVEKYVERTPLKRMATEEDFKGAAAFLASDMSSYMTGQNILVDGGWGVW